MKAKTLARVGRLGAAIGTGCRACRDWPLDYHLRDTDPSPPTVCDRCGRRFTGLIRR